MKDRFQQEIGAEGQACGWSSVDWKDTYPTREEYYVVVPARVQTKTRYGVDKFNAQWQPMQFDIDFSPRA